MTNKTIHLWIVITTIITWSGVFVDLSDEFVGVSFIAMTVFAIIGAVRLNKIN